MQLPLAVGANPMSHVEDSNLFHGFGGGLEELGHTLAAGLALGIF